MFYLIIFTAFLVAALVADTDPDLNHDGIFKNLQRIAEQLEDYRIEVMYVIIPGIKQAKGPFEIIHKTSAFGEELFDKCPRLMWYTLIYGSIITAGVAIHDYAT